MPSKSSSTNGEDRERGEIANLLEQYGGMIYGLCLRLTGDRDQAEDLFQETFLQAHRKWRQFRGESSPSTWLYTIAVRKFLRSRRRKSGEPSRIPSLDDSLPFGEGAVPIVPGDDETPLDATIRREALEELEHAITELPADYRLPLVLKEIVGFSVNETGDILGLKEATVKTRLHRARNMLYRHVTSVLPKKKLPPAEYSRRVCLDLLRAKQESLDKGVPFPKPKGEFCKRCAAVFAGMDFAQEMCRHLAKDELPASARQAVLLDLAASA